ncbi:BspA family leucine-rich repeat surface protein [Psychrobacter sp. APC 3279]|uniref:BspA family leucine-rich repeat surface protein n=1 Tax=Psychrobacter sp. APC 3279 TaxID=3035189 RepID=UPI0025B3D51D|nr:BspA family leucine-rich repeat surface protein [Psychrobacter sp. APC 3279]MDN3442320.1 BspA family leucine-rich repeat surface protein [Psychrobacter sp. APC 3279]
MPIDIVIYKPTGEWEIKESGIKVVDSSGFISTGISLITNNEDPLNISHEITLASVGLNKTYEFSGGAYSVKLRRTADPTTVDGSVRVVSFSSEVTNNRFNLHNTNLVVPSTLPDYVTSLSSMFYGSNLFNQDISGWDVSNVTSMASMLQGCELFNQDISGWDVSNVTSLSSMLARCNLFNQDISGWNVSNVTNMNSMVFDCVSLKSDLSMWCVTNITSTPIAFLGNSKPSAPFKSPVWGTCPRGENLAV